jgi:hypothetical protein
MADGKGWVSVKSASIVDVLREAAVEMKPGEVRADHFTSNVTVSPYIRPVACSRTIKLQT